MILVLSPSKTLDFDSKPRIATHTIPQFLDDSSLLIKELKTYSPAKLSKLMGISDKLAALNVSRYEQFATPFTPANAKQALLAFKGDVYTPMEVDAYTKADLAFAQKHLRILSGLYGVLKPLDLIQPYRLEMGTNLKNTRGKNLYTFWGERITDALNQAMVVSKSTALINLASEEYFGAVIPPKLNKKLINIVFKENQKGKLKIIGIFAKKARGIMANYVIKSHVVDQEQLKDFQEGGYRFDASLSDAGHWVFVRKL